MKTTGVFLIPLMFWATRSPAGETAVPTHPPELGRVAWLRDYEPAVQRANAEDKPVLILFQEVPGCRTCINYGNGALSHPLLVEAIESRFVPLAVYNNRGGADAAVLKSFHEPAWNNPVVRIVAADGTELTSRIAGDYSTFALASALVTALERSDRPAPEYLRLLVRESAARSRIAEKTVLAMACFWSGESYLGCLPGVVETRPGFLNGREVVEVSFDPAEIDYAELIQRAADGGCAQRVFARTRKQLATAGKIVGARAEYSETAIQPDREPKFHLGQTALKFLPMTELQAALINAAVGSGQDPSAYLSPRQIEIWHVIEQNPCAGWSNVIAASDFVTAWDDTCQQAAKLTPAATPAKKSSHHRINFPTLEK